VTPPAGAPPPKPQIQVKDDSGEAWAQETDLLSLNDLQKGFVVEIESDGTPFLRFGDGEYGAAPERDQTFSTRFRIGNGSVGNLGSDTLGHVLTHDSRITAVRNPLPAAGGRNPDTMEAIRQQAPWNFRKQLRAVTEADYGNAAARDPAIREARGTLRWTGSWRTAFVAIDPTPAAPNEPPPLTAAVVHDTIRQLNLMRMAGVDLAVELAVIVGLRIALAICVKPKYRRSDVAQALTGVLISGQTCDGTPGLLDRSHFSFGQTIYLSPIIAAVQQVDGVASVHATAFQRVSDPSRDAVADGFIIMQRLEIARVDNDPSRPDNGILELTLDGGQ
jgi:predicted phage baseplate assembly protein